MPEKTIETIKIQGMTCASCEMLIGGELKNLSFVEEAEVDRKSGSAKVKFKEGREDVDAAKKVIEGLGYKINEGETSIEKPVKFDLMSWFSAIALVAALYLFYRLLSGAGLLDWVSMDTEQIGLGLAFMIGIAASISTCLAVVGAVILSFAAKYKAKGTFYHANIQPHLYFQLGRIVSFFVLGGILGFIGSWFQLSQSLTGIFTIVISLVLAWMALNVMGIVPSMTAIGIKMPVKIDKYWQRAKNSDHPAAPVLLGAMSFLLPCGFTQSMQLVAVASGSAIIGSLTMLFFALGTAPVLTGIGIAATRFSGNGNLVFKKAVGLVVLLFAFYTLSSGMALYGISLDIFGGRGAEVQAADITSNVQTIVMDVDYSGFNPNVFTLKAGVPVRWVINGKQITGCTNEIIVPDYKIDKKLKPGENIVEFTPEEEGTVGFSCWMGMVRGKFIIVEDGPVSQDDSAKPTETAYKDDSLAGSCRGGSGCGGTGSCGGGCGGGCNSNLKIKE
ncbi:MAG: sulfite exporter TauE/SafE family protein [Patescibacteria group bacterium]